MQQGLGFRMKDPALGNFPFSADLFFQLRREAFSHKSFRGVGLSSKPQKGPFAQTGFKRTTNWAIHSLQVTDVTPAEAEWRRVQAGEDSQLS